MSQELLAFTISCMILLALAVWVPFLHVCFGCLERVRRTPPSTPVSPVFETRELGEAA